MERGFFNQGTRELWRSLEARTVHGGVVLHLSGCWHGMRQKHSIILPRCQSGKVVKFDSQMMSGDIAHHRKWCWTGKLF